MMDSQGLNINKAEFLLARIRENGLIIDGAMAPC